MKNQSFEGTEMVIYFQMQTKDYTVASVLVTLRESEISFHGQSIEKQLRKKGSWTAIFSYFNIMKSDLSIPFTQTTGTDLE